jgi:hypothetical protein
MIQEGTNEMAKGFGNMTGMTSIHREIAENRREAARKFAIYGFTKSGKRCVKPSTYVHTEAEAVVTCTRMATLNPGESFVYESIR